MPEPVPARSDTALTDQEWQELDASLDHLSGPDAWDEDRLEPALIPVTHYVPRLMNEVLRLRAQLAEIGETTVEWGVEYLLTNKAHAMDTEAEARDLVAGYRRDFPSHPHRVVTRPVGAWRGLDKNGGDRG